MVVLEGVSFLNARWNPSIVTKLVSGESLHFFAFLLGGTGTCVTRYTSHARKTKNPAGSLGALLLSLPPGKAKLRTPNMDFLDPIPNYGPITGSDPITGQLLGFRPNTQLFMLGQ